MKYFRLSFLVLFIAGFTVSCRKESTSWNSNWVFPLINDTLKMDKLVNDSTLEVSADNSIQFILQRDVFDIDLFSLVDIPDTTIVQTFSIAFPSLSLAPGTQYVNQTEEHLFELGDAVLFQTRTKSGKAIITIENPIATTALFNVELPGVSRNGQVFSQLESVPAAEGGSPGMRTFELDLSGYSIDMRGQNGNMYNILQSKMNVSTDPNGPTVTVTSSDVVKFKVKFQNLKFDYALGYFGSTDISDTTLIDVEVLKNITDGLINIDEVNFNLLLSNGVKVMGQGAITLLKSKNYTGSTVELSHPQINQYFNIDPASGSWSTLSPFIYQMPFNDVNSNIIPFIEHLGSEYELGYGIKVNPWGNVTAGGDEIFPNSRLKLRLEADFPLSIGAQNLTIVDTFQVNLSEQSNTIKIQSGSFILKTQNTFPFGGSAVLTLLDENGSAVGDISSDDSIDSAPIQPTGTAHKLVSNELSFVVNASTVKILPSVKSIVVKVVVNSNQLVNNQLYDNAMLKLQLLTNFQLKTSL
jgi:hypothetical protein